MTATPGEYTAFPVGGAVILIEDDRLAEALNALPQDNRDIFLMYWFLDMADREIAEYMNMARRDGQHPQAESLSAAEGADGR